MTRDQRQKCSREVEDSREQDIIPRDCFGDAHLELLELLLDLLVSPGQEFHQLLRKTRIDAYFPVGRRHTDATVLGHAGLNAGCGRRGGLRSCPRRCGSPDFVFSGNALASSIMQKWIAWSRMSIMLSQISLLSRMGKNTLFLLRFGLVFSTG